MISSATQAKPAKTSQTFVIVLVLLETFLVTLALVPAQLWIRLFPSLPGAAINGPFPAAFAPVITALLYLLPTTIGFLARDWQHALLYATLPAWVGLGLFVIGAALKMGAFYLLSTDHVTANVSLLELFLALGGIGWLIRTIIKMR